MAIDQVERKAGTAGLARSATRDGETAETDSRRVAWAGRGPFELAGGAMVLLFGLIQVIIGARLILLMLDVRAGNALVSGVLEISRVFVAPVEGILHTSAVAGGGSTLDLAALVAFAGWTILDLIVIWVVEIVGREPA